MKQHKTVHTQCEASQNTIKAISLNTFHFVLQMQKNKEKKNWVVYRIVYRIESEKTTKIKPWEVKIFSIS